MKQKIMNSVNGAIPVYYPEDLIEKAIEKEIQLRENKLHSTRKLLDRVYLQKARKKLKKEIEALKLCKTIEDITTFYQMNKNSSYSHFDDVLDFFQFLDEDFKILEINEDKLKYLDHNGYIHQKTIYCSCSQEESIHPNHFVIEFKDYDNIFYFTIIFYKQVYI